MRQNKLFKLFEGKQTSFFPIYLMDLAATTSVEKIIGKVCKRIINLRPEKNPLDFSQIQLPQGS
ncbi:hypothetical protein HY798_00005 [Candidatus Falkowbacteria bacterium]|nr:hypothetical protein [Candidatus Falkowbacteria bacterium]